MQTKSIYIKRRKYWKKASFLLLPMHQFFYWNEKCWKKRTPFFALLSWLMIELSNIFFLILHRPVCLQCMKYDLLFLGQVKFVFWYWRKMKIGCNKYDDKYLINNKGLTFPIAVFSFKLDSDNLQVIQNIQLTLLFTPPKDPLENNCTVSFRDLDLK